MTQSQPEKSEADSVHSGSSSSQGPKVDAPAFTPGPWSVGRELGQSRLMPTIEIVRYVTFVEGVPSTMYNLAEVSYPTSMQGTVGALERAANARLIAAAPDLLAQLEIAAKIINGLWLGDLPACFKPTVEVVNRINSAIARATGAQQ